MSRLRRIFFTTAIFLAAAGLLVWSVRGVDWPVVFSSMRNSDPRLVLLFLFLASLALFLRALRWRVLLSAQASIPVRLVFWAAAAGYLGNNLLPARAGELVRTVLLRSRSALTASYVIATVAVERIADAITLLAIAGIVFPEVPSVPGWLLRPAYTLVSFSVLGIGALLVLPKFGPSWVERISLPNRWKGELARILPDAMRGLATLHRLQRFFPFAGLTFAVWSLDATATVVCGRALGLPFSVELAFLLIAAMGLGSAIPAPPGYVGVYQFIAVSVLTPFGFTHTQAIAYILFAQVLSYVVIGVWGGVGFVQMRRYGRNGTGASAGTALF